ncbi:cyclic nucleotide-binding domain-containing protein [Desulfobulbus alkaliphilus]|uniref:cyclic nucleotide-binding domain-containing protein n=1 Tax=Desulfobulbus alkaliphilus TaxID=869814 RepID=UPI001964B9CA|nr:cyclic nucleotide-binding domain-containing protein [Desulfobulbus alkaliphilus]MBM9537721.1 cyclic nucleotide-binding domain-containing protein [Desulfobulbus alkaliphilus]
MEYRNAIFIVSEERSCPIYNVGEEFKVEDMALTVPEAKPACLMMVRELMKAVSTAQSFERFTHYGIRKVKFECGGCTGIIRFEFKKEKEFATLQMKLLAAAEQRAKMRHLDKFYDTLRGLEIFEPLDEDSLRDLSAQLRLKEYRENKIILKKGDPGTNLYIVLEGRVAVIGDEGQTLSEMGVGDIFGEMSLLSGEPVTTSIHSRDRTRLATLSSKDFKHVLNRYPVLQVFFYRMLVERAQANTMRSGTISSGMTGRLSEINAVELFQLINSSQKTGKVLLTLDDGNAVVTFNEGELVKVQYREITGKEAFFTLLAKGEGNFTYTSGLSPEDMELPVIGGFMGLIMEGMRRIDEQEG